jgi:histidinol dehydrogenase
MTKPATWYDERCPSAGVVLRFSGALAALSAGDVDALLDRSTPSDGAVREATTGIIRRVRATGDEALYALARELDGVELETLEVPRARWAAAFDSLAPDLRRAMERAAANIARVHRAFLPRAAETSPEPGIVIGRRPDPLNRVGVYAPGGRATYPSSVLMGAIPARVAGVREVVLCSPPSSDGSPSPSLLAAAHLAQVDRVFALGGAGAIAAMALGTSTVPRVDRVVGPGNAYVAEAKLQLSRAVGIDSPAGPSELLVLADEGARADIVARELLAQAEHDPLTCVVAVVVGEAQARSVEHAIGVALNREAAYPRRDIVEQALAGQGGVLWVTTLEEGIDFANRYASEHLLLASPRPETCERALLLLRNAGTVFVGESSSNAFGDYMTGANHVLPTGGLARSYSGLSVLDFIRWTTYQRVDYEAAARLAEDVAVFATAEALPGHARAARAWHADAIHTTSERPGLSVKARE